MSALTANAQIDNAVLSPIHLFEVQALAHIWKGSAVGKNPAGYVKPFEPGDEFVGLAFEEADNTTGGNGDTDVVDPTTGLPTQKGTIQVYTEGDFVLTLTSVTTGDIGRPVYATSSGDYAFTGHPDAYVGRVKSKDSTNKAWVTLKRPGEVAPNDGSSINIMVDYATEQHAALDENDGFSGSGKLKVTGVGAGLTAGTTGLLLDQDNGEAVLLLDNDSEAENVSLETARCFNITKGITAEFTCRKSVVAATAADIDFGLAGGIDITTTQLADMQATTASFLYALFHIDAEDDNVDFCSDNNSTVVAPTDTTIDNAVGTNKTYRVIVRTDGTVEAWVDSGSGFTRVLSSTAFAVGASGILAGVFNIEKGANTDVPEARLRKMRVAGALA